MKQMKRYMAYVAIVALSTAEGILSANPGDLNDNFGYLGTVTTPIGDGNAYANGVAIEEGTNKIVAAGRVFDGSTGNNVFAVARYRTDGELDTDFKMVGTVTTPIGSGNALANGVAIEEGTNKIVAAGYAIDGNYVFAVARYRTDGELDTDFNMVGTVTTTIGDGGFAQANGVAIDGDEKIVAAGYAFDSGSGNYVFAVARYRTDGELDTDFNMVGTVTTAIGYSSAYAYGVAIEEGTNKIVAAGFASISGISASEVFAVARYRTDGELDTDFNMVGTVTTNFPGYNAQARGVAIDGDGKIVAAGYANGDAGDTPSVFAVARYRTDGELDTDFNMVGTVTTSFPGYSAQAYGVAIEEGTNKIIAAGYAIVGSNNVFAVARYMPNGQLDDSFGTGGIVTTTQLYNSGISGMGVGLNTLGNIVVAGLATGDDGSTPVFGLAEYKGGCALNISGTVIDADTSLGIPNIPVELYDGGFGSKLADTATDSNGVYAFTSGLVVSTTYGIRAQLSECYTPTYSDAIILSLTCGTNYVSTLTFTAPASALLITGSVIDADTSLGISGASVALYDVTMTTTVESVTTNTSGVYEFSTGITAGDVCIVTASKIGYTPSQLSTTLTVTCGTNTVGTFTFTQSEVPASVDTLTAAIQRKYFGLVV